MSDVTVTETCCYCRRNLPLDRLVYNESRKTYYCADSDDCHPVHDPTGQSTHAGQNRTHRQAGPPHFSLHIRQSSCGSALLGLVTGCCVFFGSWGYAIKTYGWFLGLGLGWIPAVFLGILAGMFWPAAILFILALLIFSR